MSFYSLLLKIFFLFQSIVIIIIFYLIGELLVIEELCLFGNLHDYLITNKDSFVNELHETSTMELQNGANLVQPNNQEPIQQ